MHSCAQCCRAFGHAVGAVAGVRVGCYANGFKTTTTQWLTGSSEGLVESDAGALWLCAQPGR